MPVTLHGVFLGVKLKITDARQCMDAMGGIMIGNNCGIAVKQKAILIVYNGLRNITGIGSLPVMSDH